MHARPAKHSPTDRHPTWLARLRTSCPFISTSYRHHPSITHRARGASPSPVQSGPPRVHKSPSTQHAPVIRRLWARTAQRWVRVQQCATTYLSAPAGCRPTPGAPLPASSCWGAGHHHHQLSLLLFAQGACAIAARWLVCPDREKPCWHVP
ncbi:hypothetical protein BDY21DRAFT_199819 [Lineolata rhizophorae]|uniref:Uncharacterized protein n=1 Tax=Lineolata rhizophorae TaxID=578093 RepID=A0A6A6P573_9PEZI|nr:hypothetical protein BDY21DRAFT_199819 [Lineolata rhizophorae]